MAVPDKIHGMSSARFPSRNPPDGRRFDEHLGGIFAFHRRDVLPRHTRSKSQP